MDLCVIARHASDHVRGWLGRQPQLKEESITDWLLDHISTQSREIAYYLFNRHEEATSSGADWDWWLVLGTSCFKLRIQAKKTRRNYDHYRDIAHSNQSGLQIELLINSAARLNFYPLYALYGDIAGTERCREDSSGIWLGSAVQIYRGVVAAPRARVTKEQLHAYTIPFHCLFCSPLVREPGDGGPRGLFEHYFDYPTQPGGDEGSLARHESELPGYESETPGLIVSLLEMQDATEAGGLIREYQAVFPDSAGVIISRYGAE